MSNVDQLEREIARQLSRDNEIAKLAAKKEAVTATLQAQASLREQAKAMLNNPELKHQTQLKKQPEVKLQSEQLTKRFDDQMVEVNALLASIPGGKPVIKAVKATADVEVTNATHNTITTELADENYRTTLITNMIQLIHSRRKK